MKQRAALPHARKMVALVALVTALVTAFTISPAATAAPPTGTVDITPVTGTLANGGTFNGVFTPTRFMNQNGELAVTGVVTGAVTSATGTTPIAPQTVTTAVTSAAATGSCQILDLVLGPLDLNLLGLKVHLDTVHLNITAQSGAGNLLGNLLCAVAGLLDGTGINGLAALLNRLLGL